MDRTDQPCHSLDGTTPRGSYSKPTGGAGVVIGCHTLHCNRRASQADLKTFQKVTRTKRLGKLANARIDNRQRALRHMIRRKNGPLPRRAAQTNPHSKVP